jgi:hypothetical protein
VSFLASRRLAVALGILLPLGETVRRWGTGGPWWAWVDDYLAGGFLLYGAWRATRNARIGQRFLSAAWAFAAAMGYVSFFSHLEHLYEPDRGRIPQGLLTLIIGVGWVVVILALVGSLRTLPTELDRTRKAGD